MQRNLGQLKPGETGLISAVGGEDTRIKRRLTDMGITPMTRVDVRKIAPMGDPIEIHIRGYDLSLRRNDANAIFLFAPEEEEAALLREESFLKAREEKASVILSEHSGEDDAVAHKKAARLTEWAVVSQNAHVRAPMPICDKQYSKREKKRKCRRKERCKTCGAAQDHARLHDNQPIKLALVGNPNSGKTTLFNAMTGAREYVGNWPGVTVEKKEGKINAYGHEMTLVDLPGIYSLSPYSMEEVIARNYIVQEKPDAIINIVDGTNLERNLYLTVQLMELERPLILAVNMMDEVEKLGDKIDVSRLALELGVPVVPISARTGAGVEELVHACELLLTLVHEQMHRGFCIEPDHVYDDYTHAMHHEIDKIIGDAAVRADLPAHWAQIKILEDDALVRAALKLSPEQDKALGVLLERYAGKDPRFDNATRIADSRYRFISRVTKAALVRKREKGERSMSDKIDAVLTNKYLAIPVFLLIMLFIFTLTFGTVGAYLSEQVEYFIGDALTPWVGEWLSSLHVSAWLVSLITDGILAGVGGVLTFLPWIAILFLCLSILEDSGYLSRTAFIMDKPLRKFGLSGKSFIPMLMGFGCTVPATMGARAMDNEKHRRMTILLLPFMSCSAKLPVYGMIAGAFFSKYAPLVVFSLYALGILAGILTGLLFKRTLLKGPEAPFVMEMPPYRRPILKNTLQHVGEHIMHFLEKAGTIILLMTVALWFLQSFDLQFNMVEQAENSVIGKLGSLIAPAFSPLGFGAWQAVVALLAGFVAKEAVVSSLTMFYGLSAMASDTVVHTTLSSTFAPLSAYSYLVFVLLYVPCMAAVATMRRELNSTKWTFFMVLYQIITAYIIALLIYQTGLLFFA